MSTKSSRPATKRPRKAAPAAKARSKPTRRAPAARSRAAVAPEPSGTKQSRLIALLTSPAGGTIDQMTSLTGWQPHTVRGTISGVLRKRMGLQVSCERAAGGAGVYRIAARPRE
jgi:hypothetical protein